MRLKAAQEEGARRDVQEVDDEVDPIGQRLVKGLQREC